MDNCTFLLAILLVLFRVFSNADSSPTKLVCFMANWGRWWPSPMAYYPENVPADVCDILVYMFFIVDRKTFEIKTKDYESDYGQDGLRDIARLKREHPGIQLVISVGGYDDSEGIPPVQLYSEMMSTPENRSAFVQSARRFLVEQGFDGLDLQWYYPGKEDRSNFVALLKDLYQEFANYSLKVYATVPYYNADIEAGYDVPEISKLVSLLFVRTIDMQVYIDNYVADNASPLHRRSIDIRGSPKYDQNVETVLDKYLRRGAPKEKLVFGVQFYGHSFILKNKEKTDLGAAVSGKDTEMGTFSRDSEGILFYHEICARIQSGKWISKRHEESGIPYAYNPNTGQWASYDDQEILIRKAKYAKSSGIGGIFAWQLDVDDFLGLCGEKHGLLRSLARELKDTGSKSHRISDNVRTTSRRTTTTETNPATAEKTTSETSTVPESSETNVGIQHSRVHHREGETTLEKFYGPSRNKNPR